MKKNESPNKFYRLLLKIGDSSKSNGIKFPGFLMSLQQKEDSAHHTLSMKPRK